MAIEDLIAKHSEPQDGAGLSHPPADYWGYGPGLDIGDVWEPTKSLFGAAVNVIDTPGAAVRTALHTGSLGKAWDSVWDTSKRSSTEDLLKDIGYQNYGTHDGQFEWGDVIDFGANALTGAVTDPLMYFHPGLTTTGMKAERAGQELIGAGLGKTGIASAADKAAALAKYSEATGKTLDATQIGRHFTGLEDTLAGRIGAGEVGLKFGIPGTQAAVDVPVPQMFAKPLAYMSEPFALAGDLARMTKPGRAILDAVGTAKDYLTNPALLSAEGRIEKSVQDLAEEHTIQMTNVVRDSWLRAKERGLTDAHTSLIGDLAQTIYKDPVSGGMAIQLDTSASAYARGVHPGLRQAAGLETLAQQHQRITKEFLALNTDQQVAAWEYLNDLFEIGKKDIEKRIELKLPVAELGGSAKKTIANLQVERESIAKALEKEEKSGGLMPSPSPGQVPPEPAQVIPTSVVEKVPPPVSEAGLSVRNQLHAQLLEVGMKPQEAQAVMGVLNALSDGHNMAHGGGRDFFAERIAGVVKGTDEFGQQMKQAYGLSGVPMGAAEMLEDGRTLIHVFKDGVNADTVLHEVGHVLRKNLDPEANKVITDFMRQTHGIDLPDGVMAWEAKRLFPDNPELIAKAERAEEIYAQTWQNYLKTGNAPTQELKKVFSQLREWLTGLWHEMTGMKSTDLQISPEIKKHFDELLGAKVQAKPLKFAPGQVDAAGNLKPFKVNGANVEAVARARAKFEPLNYQIVEDEQGYTHFIPPGHDVDAHAMSRNPEAALREIEANQAKIKDISEFDDEIAPEHWDREAYDEHADVPPDDMADEVMDAKRQRVEQLRDRLQKSVDVGEKEGASAHAMRDMRAKLKRANHALASDKKLEAFAFDDVTPDANSSLSTKQTVQEGRKVQKLADVESAKQKARAVRSLDKEVGGARGGTATRGELATEDYRAAQEPQLPRLDNKAMADEELEAAKRRLLSDEEDAVAQAIPHSDLSMDDELAKRAEIDSQKHELVKQIDAVRDEIATAKVSRRVPKLADGSPNPHFKTDAEIEGLKEQLKQLKKQARSQDLLFQTAQPIERDKNFKDWFGESKVTDEQGQPLRVYHGTGKSFDAFSKKTFGQGSGAVDEPVFFFSSRHETADNYANYARGGNVMPTYLSLKNPAEIDMGGLSYGQSHNKVSELIQMAKEQGHDGVIFRNFKDGGPESDVFAAFEPNQIKSATGNRGTFSRESDNILHQTAQPNLKAEELRTQLAAKDEEIRLWEQRQRETPGYVPFKMTEEAADKAAQESITSTGTGTAIDGTPKQREAGRFNQGDLEGVAMNRAEYEAKVKLGGTGTKATGGEGVKNDVPVWDALKGFFTKDGLEKVKKQAGAAAFTEADPSKAFARHIATDLRSSITNVQLRRDIVNTFASFDQSVWHNAVEQAQGGATLESITSFLKKEGIKIDDVLPSDVLANLKAGTVSVKDAIKEGSKPFGWDIIENVYDGKDVSGGSFRNIYVPRQAAETYQRMIALSTKQMPEFLKNTLGALSTYTSMWRRAQTLPWMKFHMRNAIGDFVRLAQTDSLDSKTGGEWLQTFGPVLKDTKILTAMGKGDFTAFKELQFEVGAAAEALGGSNGMVSGDRLLAFASKNGQFNAGVMGQNMIEAMQKEVSKGTRLGKVRAVGDRLAGLASFREDANRIAALATRMRAGDSPMAAVLRVEQALFNQNRISPAAKFLRQTGIAPFIGWSAKNIPAQIEWAVTNPGQFSAALRGIEMLQNNEISDDALPQYMRNKFNLVLSKGKDSQGKESWQVASASGFLPFTDLTDLMNEMKKGAPTGYLSELLGPMFKVWKDIHDNEDDSRIGDIVMKNLVGKPYSFVSKLMDIGEVDARTGVQRPGFGDTLVNEVVKPYSTVDLNVEKAVTQANNRIKSAVGKASGRVKSLIEMRNQAATLYGDPNSPEFNQINQELDQARAKLQKLQLDSQDALARNQRVLQKAKQKALAP